MGDVVKLRPEQKKQDPALAAETIMANALYDIEKLFNKMGTLRVVSRFVDWKGGAQHAWDNRHLLYAKELDFIQQLRYYRANPSAKQVMWLDDILGSLADRAELLANPPLRRKPKAKAAASRGRIKRHDRHSAQSERGDSKHCDST